MKGLMSLAVRVSGVMRGIGAAALAGMMFLTVVDVILRYVGRPFMGTYEIVSLAGAVVIGFAVPQTTLEDGNVKVDFLVEAASGAIKRGLIVGTRLLGVALFCMLGYGLVAKATEVLKAGEVSLTLHIPFYPVAYGLGICSFVEAAVLLFLLFEALQEGGPSE